MLATFARELGLAEPRCPGTARAVRSRSWAPRWRAAGAVEKVALDILLLAQTEVGEVAEASGDGRGGSSAMPHKRNPVGAVRARAAARAVRAAAGVLLEAMAGEHERAAGAWHSEWAALSDALAHTGGAAWSLHEALSGLEVDAERMRANLELGESDEAARSRRASRGDERVHRPGAEARVTVELNHRLEGPDGAPVVIFAGSLGANLSMWDEQAATFTTRHRVLRFDHRGHGGSPVPPGPYTMDELAGDVLALLDRLAIDRVTFCGLSLGGAVGMTLALRAPERIERLVLCSTAMQFGPPEQWLDRAATVRDHGIEALAPSVLERWLTPSAPPEMVARLYSILRSTPAEGYAAAARRSRGHDLRGALGAIGAPTLAIAAAHDPATPPAQLEAIAAEVPGRPPPRARRCRAPVQRRAGGRFNRDALRVPGRRRHAHAAGRCSATTTSTARSRRRPTSRPTSRTSSRATRGARSGPGRASTGACAAPSR